MSFRWRPRSLRARLTLWYAAALAAILLVYAGGAYAFLRRNLYAELDRQLRDELEEAEGTLDRGGGGDVFRLRGPGAAGHEGGEVQGRRLEVWSADGRLLYREGAETPRLPPPDLGRDGLRRDARSVRAAAGVSVRLRETAHRIRGASVRIRAARSEERLRRELGELLAGMGLGLPAAVLLAGTGGFFLAGRVLDPVGRMAERARTITAERLGERLPIDDPEDELGRLGTVLNETLARLERSFEALRRFTADAAHELRTPLTALRSVGEVALGETRTDRGYREVVGSMLEEVDRMTRLVEALLTLSRADAGGTSLTLEPVDLAAFARAMADYVGVLADERAQTVVVEGEAEVPVAADPLVLRQAVLNLLDNAIRHTPDGGVIRIVVRRTPDGAALEVVDRGPGVAPEDRERIFERFYRADPARSRETGGAGLGLSIARWAVEAHGGTLHVESRVGKGSAFRIRLPEASGGATLDAGVGPSAAAGEPGR